MPRADQDHRGRRRGGDQVAHRRGEWGRELRAGPRLRSGGGGFVAGEGRHLWRRFQLGPHHVGARARGLARSSARSTRSVAAALIQDAEVFAAGRPTRHDQIPEPCRPACGGSRRRSWCKRGSARAAGSATAYGCDLSYDYAGRSTADYSSLIVPTEGGGVAKDDRLVNYSPGFKVSLLVEVPLVHRSARADRCCVVKYGGAAML